MGSYKRVYLGAGSGVVTILGLFMLLTSFGLVITSDGDIICDGTLDDPCVSYITIKNPTAKSIYIYNNDDIKLDFSPNIKEYKLYVKYYGKWRYINFTMETRLGNIPDDRKYVFVFPRYSTKEFKLVGYKNNPSDSIKWGIGIKDDYLDPIWFPKLSKEDELKTILINTTLKTDIRKDGYMRKVNDKTGKLISYNPDKREILLENYVYKPLLKLKLTSPYTTSVIEGADVKVAEFILEDYDESINLFDSLYAFDIKDNYKHQERSFNLKYGTDYIEEECQLLPETNITYYYNTTKTNWTNFTQLSELPNKNIKVGLFTNTKIGEKIEWIPVIQGFDILEWADWDVTSGTKHEFDTVLGNYNSLVKIDSTHYINVYAGTDYDGYAVVLTVNQTDWTITNGTKHEFDTVLGNYNSLVKIDSTHYINAYQGLDDDGYAIVFTVNQTDWTITNGTKHEFDTGNGQYNSLVQIDSTHYINAYMGPSWGSYAVVLTVNQTDWTITSGDKCAFAENFSGGYYSLVKIDNTHYLNAYHDDDNDGCAVVLIVNQTDWTITNGTKHKFDTVYGQYNSLVQIDSIHYLNAYMGTDWNSTIVVLTVNQTDWTITSGDKHAFTGAFSGGYYSLVKIDSTHYLNAYSGDNNGYAIVFTVNQTDWTITNGTKHEFDTDNNQYNSLVQIDSDHYLNTYQGLDSDGYAVVINVEVPSVGDTTNPTYSNNAHNTTLNGTTCLFSIEYNDDTALHPNGQYIFSTNNTGVWINESEVNFTTTPSSANVSKTLNTTVGLSIGYRWYADDNATNINNTDIFTLTTTSDEEIALIPIIVHYYRQLFRNGIQNNEQVTEAIMTRIN